MNIFLGQAERHGPEWRAIVLCRDGPQMRMAVEDARTYFKNDKVKCRFDGSGMYVTLDNGARLNFRLAYNKDGVYSALAGRVLTQIVWLYSPTEELREYAAHTLRSGIVPHCDFRHEVVRL